MRQPVQVLIHPVRRSSEFGWEYLLLRRPPERGGFWQGASGGVEDDEKLAEAAQRELMEETGLTPLRMEKTDFSYSFPLQDQWRHLFAPGVTTITEYVFVAQIASEQEPVLSHEHDAYKWCKFDEALAMLRTPEERKHEESLKYCQQLVLCWNKT